MRTTLSDRRNRTISEMQASTPPATASTWPVCRTPSTRPAEPPTAAGFGAGKSGSRAGPKVCPMVNRSQPAPISQPTHRHRREGSEPVGNSSSVRKPSARPAVYSGCPARSASAVYQAGALGCGAGSPVAAVARVYASAEPSSSQPIGLPGTRDATSAPTVAKASRNAITATVTNSWLSPPSLVAERYPCPGMRWISSAATTRPHRHRAAHAGQRRR